VDRVHVRRGVQHDAAAAGQRFVFVADARTGAFHVGDSRRLLRVNQHGRGEIAFAEHHGDVLQVGLDL
jgi:hypothetical protein